MRVIQINSVCGIGSTGRIATDIHNILIEEGHESYIAYGRDIQKNCNTAIKIGTRFDNYMHVVTTRVFDKHGFGSKKATKKFIEQLERINPDIIHLHNIHGYYLNTAVLFEYLKKSNKPVIWTLHDCWAFTGHCAYFDYEGCEKWKSGCNKCPQKNEYPSSFLFDSSFKNYKKKKALFSGMKNLTIVTPSKWLADLVKESYLKEYSVEVINNGIDLNLFKQTKNNFRENNNLENKYIILGVASTWDRRKGLKYFLDLSETLSVDEVLVLVGLSEKQLKNLPNNIIGISRTNSIEELSDIYSSADIFVNPTLEDNFPTTNLEALACGTPVITFNTGGSSESVDVKTGLVVTKGDLNELKNAISLLKGRKNYYTENCEIKAKACYSKQDRFYEYLKLYELHIIK